MKKLAVVLLAGALVALIVQPVTFTVNTPSGNSGLTNSWSAPPFPPSSNSVLRADGDLPPPWPKPSGLTRDGASGSSVLRADGDLPPPWPKPSALAPDGAPAGALLS